MFVRLRTLLATRPSTSDLVVRTRVRGPAVSARQAGLRRTNWYLDIVTMTRRR